MICRYRHYIISVYVSCVNKVSSCIEYRNTIGMFISRKSNHKS